MCASSGRFCQCVRLERVLLHKRHMRSWTFLILVLALIGCGGSGGGSSESEPPPPGPDCASLYAQADTILRHYQDCQVDSDCHFVSSQCIGMCGSFINTSGHDELAAVATRLAEQSCAQGCTCSAIPPACISGHCGAKPRP